MKKEKQESKKEEAAQQKIRQEETEQGFERLPDEDMKQVSGGLPAKKRK